MSGKCHLKNLKAPQTPQRKGWARGVHLGLALGGHGCGLWAVAQWGVCSMLAKAKLN